VAPELQQGFDASRVRLGRECAASAELGAMLIKDRQSLFRVAFLP
jgi:hypothetical protein